MTMMGSDQVTHVTSYDMQEFDQTIENFYKKSNQVKTPFLKLQSAAQLFLNKTYVFEALGEGKNAEFSQEALYRTDQFDCVTFVDTLLALLYAKNLVEFQEKILALRYLNSEVNYIKRTDWFTDFEWIPNAQKNNFLSDITSSIVKQDGEHLFQTAVTIIDKPNWYRVKPLKALHLIPPLPQPIEVEKLLAKLRNTAELFKAETSSLTYLPLDKLFNQNGETDKFIFNQLPDISVILIVRPDWDIKNQFPGFPQGYGTNLNVSHLGIALREQSELIFYHATSVLKKVVRVPLHDYLKPLITNNTVKGIHIEKIIV